jgi:hypothetical protein
MIDHERLKNHLANGKPEYVMCSACYVNDDIDHLYKPYNIDKGLVYSGWRHPSIFETMPKGTPHTCIQGFLTTKNRFLTRNEALTLVKSNGQLTANIIGGELTSEDLW